MPTEPLVIDASSILAICKNDESGREEAAAIKGRALIAPESVRWELINALGNAVAHNNTSRSTAHKALILAGRLGIAYVPVSPSAALELALQTGIYAYDACVLQCALERGLALLTSEKDTGGRTRMPTIARELGVFVVRLKKWQAKKSGVRAPTPRKRLPATGR